MITERTDAERDRRLAVWVRCAPARALIQTARRDLLEAASLFYAAGETAMGDRYWALARQIQPSG